MSPCRVKAGTQKERAREIEVLAVDQLNRYLAAVPEARRVPLFPARDGHSPLNDSVRQVAHNKGKRPSTRAQLGFTRCVLAAKGEVHSSRSMRRRSLASHTSASTLAMNTVGAYWR